MSENHLFGRIIYFLVWLNVERSAEPEDQRVTRVEALQLHVEAGREAPVGEGVDVGVVGGEVQVPGVLVHVGDLGVLRDVISCYYHV